MRTRTANVPERVIALQTGHESMTILRRCIREGSLFRENAAARVGLCPASPRIGRGLLRLTRRRLTARRGSRTVTDTELVEYIAKALVDHPEQVRVTQVAGAHLVVLELRVAPEDRGRVIGKRGWIFDAIQVLVQAAAARRGKRVTLLIV